MAYLDANAGEPLRPEARDALIAALALSGNPSSIHADGRAMRAVLEDARETLAACFGAAPADVVFTGSGTEADALALHALGAGRRLIRGATEHDAVRAAAQGAAVVPVDRDGVADLDALARLLDADSAPALVCLLLANNETGAIQPIARAAALCRAAGALLFVDAAQAAGRIPVSLPALGADALAISAHKLGGPAGVGALLLAPDAPFAAPLIAGGGQERGRRGGTQTPALAAGFAAAARAATAAMAAESARLAALRDMIEARARAAGAIAVGANAPRLPNTACLALPGVRAETQVIALDLAGWRVSAGAACSAGKVARSHVLDAMGLGAAAGEAIRVSLPWNATQAEAAGFAAAYADMAARMRPPLAPRAA